jgi:tetratricopeptide (TPR) repeat protein
VDDPEPTLLQFVYHMEEVPFSQEGEHSLILLVDDGQIAELTFQVRLSGAAAGVREAEWGDRLQEGVDAFSAGDGVGAEEIFREIIKHRPDLAAARNNLAFIQLSQGKAAEAREQFLEAGRLEFDRSELLDANIACCDYLLSNFTLALARFERCFKARPFTGQSILFGIQEDHLFPVDLESAADYLALMLLNAAWCALRVPAVEKARDYAHRASEFDIVTATPVTQDLPLIARSLALVQGKSGAGPPP